MRCEICGQYMERMIKDECVSNSMYVKKSECWLCTKCLFTVDIIKTRYANTILDEV